MYVYNIISLSLFFSLCIYIYMIYVYIYIYDTYIYIYIFTHIYTHVSSMVRISLRSSGLCKYGRLGYIPTVRCIEKSIPEVLGSHGQSVWETTLYWGPFPWRVFGNRQDPTRRPTAGVQSSTCSASVPGVFLTMYATSRNADYVLTVRTDCHMLGAKTSPENPNPNLFPNMSGFTVVYATMW